MHEHEYLGDEAVAQFIAFLRGLILEGYPGLGLRVGTEGRRRDVTTLREALDGYCWQSNTFATVNRKVEALRCEMRAALVRCRAAESRAERSLAELELLFVATKTLSWGRVYEGAFPFLIHQAETGVLSENLLRAAALLDGDVEDVAAFDDKPYRSDCGVTKVYAAINRRTVVYDDRLGAALAFLCCRHLERERRPLLPASLAFMVGDREDRCHNPSSNAWVFRPKGSGSEHARWNLRASWIISRVAADPDIAAALGGHRRDRIRKIEAALFTVGEDIQDQPAAASPPARAPRRRREAAPAVSRREPSSS